ncbi:4-hydroxyphenylpyruvate dioxygenase [Paraburkholderia sp. C35]|uniref:4-hydroxyphenylpyruvate dioxygenase n=1 Tax=Paraburkholderia sp. C35 TaxID=2126993 RepID=UPI001EF4C291|nr:4-hydroxyphenylpyruvate dioxygenase [Paraburkholderia sp. C35]
MTAGFAFVEFVCRDPGALVALFARLGFRVLGQHAHSGAILLRQGDAVLLVNPAPNPFRDVHGTSARAIAIRVDDAEHALAQALKGGARQATPAGFGAFAVDVPAIVGIGDSLVYFVDHDIAPVFSTPYRPGQVAEVADAAILAIDHTSNIVKPENLDYWADFYKDTFAFVQKQYLDVKGRQTGMRARSMVSPCGKVSIPIAAAAHDQPGVLNQNDEFIRDYGGEGIQHIAFLSSNIEQTIAVMDAAGIGFMDPPPSAYYRNLDARVPGHGQNLDNMERQGLLVDGKRDGRILLQRFTRRQIGPIFFEIIERRGEDGFGEGNFKALFESQEQDQVRRGSLDAS